MLIRHDTTALLPPVATNSGADSTLSRNAATAVRVSADSVVPSAGTHSPERDGNGVAGVGCGAGGRAACTAAERSSGAAEHDATHNQSVSGSQDSATRVIDGRTARATVRDRPRDRGTRRRRAVDGWSS